VAGHGGGLELCGPGARCGFGAKGRLRVFHKVVEMDAENPARFRFDPDAQELFIECLSVASVRRWRLLRQGPKYLKIGAAVRYKPEDVSTWLESRPTGGHQAEAE
jgi:hypothetical protein